MSWSSYSTTESPPWKCPDTKYKTSVMRERVASNNAQRNWTYSNGGSSSHPTTSAEHTPRACWQQRHLRIAHRFGCAVAVGCAHPTHDIAVFAPSGIPGARGTPHTRKREGAPIFWSARSGPSSAGAPGRGIRRPCKITMLRKAGA